MVVFLSDLRSIPTRTFYFSRVRFDSRSEVPASVLTPSRFGGSNAAVRTSTVKPSICTADDLHYVSVHKSDWRLALWHYKPPPEAPPRNHPLLLLSGVGTNAIGFDLSPGSSFARYMSSQGFDTWTLEVRGAGLSTEEVKSVEVKKPVNGIPEQINSAIEHKKNGRYSVDQSRNMNSNALAEKYVSSIMRKVTYGFYIHHNCGQVD